MPPTKEPKQPSAGSAEAVLTLFAKNLEEIRRWYRGARSPGAEVGHVVMTELVLANVADALSKAIEGKAWEAPAHSP